MELYSIKSQSIAGKLSISQLETANAQLAAIQKRENLKITSLKDAFVKILEIAAIDPGVKEEVPTILPEVKNDILIKIGSLVGLSEEEATEEEILSTIQFFIENQKTDDVPEVVEVPVVGFALDLNETQKSTLEKIRRWRHAKGLDHSATTQETAKGLIFNIGTLTDYAETFATGLTSTKLKKASIDNN